ncbi:MAG TPA: CPBP family glutamic-type intramembrane protease, partial [Anaerolineae bacterium]|nr:CPBP family glutamic-type intramembrane protease [Anaerolineae bacterium]
MVRSTRRLLLLAAVVSSAYAFVVRPWHLRWGATNKEITKPLPGDEILPSPKLQATHAITINAPSDKVWPWLVQIGHGRGGFYSYDWIENLVGLNIHSADKILDEFQHLKVGDTVPLAPSGFGPPVVAIEPGKYLALGGTMEPKPGSYFSSSWGFSLEDLGGNVTRLVERFRLDWSPSLANELFYRSVLEPGSFMMERKMLLGIKKRAESRHPPRRLQVMNASGSSKRSPLTFFVLVFALSIPVWLVIGGRPLPGPINLPVSSLWNTFVPLVAASILVYREEKFAGIKRLLKRAFDYKSIKPKIWYVPIIFLMPLIYLLSYGVMRLIGRPLPAEWQISFLAIPLLFVAFFIGAAGEELGWMGYAIDPMQDRWSALTASLILGLVWAIWHVVPNIQLGRTLTSIAWWSLATVG